MSHILIVEDEPALARALSITLRARGYDTTVANTGSAGLERAADSHPDLILLDLALHPAAADALVAEYEKLSQSMQDRADYLGLLARFVGFGLAV